MKKILALSLIFFLLNLTACGFHLRGRTPLPSQLQHIYIQTENPYDPFIIVLKDSLEDMNVDVVDDPTRAKLTLHVIKQTITHSLGNISASTNTRQYTIYYSVEFSLQEKQQHLAIAPTTLSTYKSLIVNSNQILGSSSEEQTLIEEMRQSLAQLIIAKLGSRNTLRALTEPAMTIPTAITPNPAVN